MLKTGTWILIADGEKALFLENAGDELAFNFEVVRKEEQANPSTAEQATDAPGRFNDGPSVHRSAVQETDWHQLEKDRFAHDLAEILYQRAHAGRFRKIVLVAPPKTLGMLRDTIHSEVEDKVIGEVPKTLTTMPIHEIEEHLFDEFGAKG